MRWMKAILVLLIAMYAFPLQGHEEKALHMTDAMGHVYWVSSELSPPREGLGKYGGHHLFDNNEKTAWVEGVAGGGIGERIRVILPGPLDHIDLVNGYAKSPGIFQANNRIREIRITAFSARLPREGQVTETGIPVILQSVLTTFSATLGDTAGSQEIAVPALWREKTTGKYPLVMEIEIRSIYPGNRFNDTCLSELSLVLDKKLKVDIRNRDSEVWLVRGSREHLVIREPESVFQLVETDKNSHWAILIEMPAHAGGRVETHYRLLSMDKRRFISTETLGADIGEFYGFEIRDGKLYLRAANTQSATEIWIDMEAVQP